MINTETRLFSGDKNYILKEVQSDMKLTLLESAHGTIVASYHKFHNPLGIKDEFTEKLDTYIFQVNPILETIYNDLAGFYRFQNAGNQLELIFDGSSHYAKFGEEWQSVFLSWITELCKTKTVIKALLGATVFYPGKIGEELITSRIRSHLNKHFNLKIYRYRGIQEYFAA